jgi:hypothetical protein
MNRTRMQKIIITIWIVLMALEFIDLLHNFNDPQSFTILLYMVITTIVCYALNLVWSKSN